MKKTLLTLISILLIVALFTSCNKASDTEPTTDPINTEEQTLESSEEFTTERNGVLINWGTLSVVEFQEEYWNGTPVTGNVTEGFNHYEFHKSDNVTWLECENGLRYYNPRLARDGHTILYVYSDGTLNSLGAETGYATVANQYPTPNKEYGTYNVILSSPEVTVFWSEAERMIVEKSNNQIVRSEKLPEGSVYRGYSYWAGFIFQSEDKVYSVFQPRAIMNTILIAEGVDTVIATDYMLTSDAWSNPLFLMKDGSLKGYITWEKELFVYDSCNNPPTYYPYDFNR